MKLVKLGLALLLMFGLLFSGCIQTPQNGEDANKPLVVDQNQPVVSVGNDKPLSTGSDDPDDTNAVGGDRTEEGCLVGAGFSYNEEIGACVRNWEFTEESDINAARTAVNFVGKTYGLAVDGDFFERLRCIGCYELTLVDAEYNFYPIVIDNWVPSYKQTVAEDANHEITVEFNSDTNELTFTMVLLAPRSCDSFELVNKRVLESNPTQVVIEMESVAPKMVCAEVITPRNFEGTIKLGEKPGVVSVKIDGKIVASTTEIN